MLKPEMNTAIAMRGVLEMLDLHIRAYGTDGARERLAKQHGGPVAGEVAQTAARAALRAFRLDVFGAEREASQ